MQASEEFKKVINDHLKGVAESDTLFAEALKKPGKNINDCVTYILNTVKKSGRNGFADSEIFGMAVHYYDEDKIDVGKATSAQVVINRTVGSPKKSASRVDAPVKKESKKEVKAYATLFDIDETEDKATAAGEGLE